MPYVKKAQCAAVSPPELPPIVFLSGALAPLPLSKPQVTENTTTHAGPGTWNLTAPS